MSQMPNSYMKAYMTKRRHERRSRVVTLLGSKCQACGEVEGLEVDHVDPTLKTIELNKRGLAETSWPRIEAELKNCQLLCRPCHLIKTKSQRWPTPPKHGTTARYKHRVVPCHCHLCREAYNQYHRAYRRRRNAL